MNQFFSGMYGAISGFLGDYKQPRFASNNNRWQHRSRAGKCHRWEHWPHRHIRRQMARKSRQINRRRAA